jgi:hypothetical protein
MKTKAIFKRQNEKLMKKLLPKDGELPESYFSIDPFDIIFTKKIQ